MGTVPGVRRYAAGVLALVAATAGWRLTALPDTSAVETSADFSFHARSLGPPAQADDRVLRPVAPGYANLRSLVSALGAGVALFDVDGEVVADDLCLVDPRRDTVTVRPAPGTSRGYRPFTLVPPERRRHGRRRGACPPISTRTAGRTWSSTTGAAPPPCSCAYPGRPRPVRPSATAR